MQDDLHKPFIKSLVAIAFFTIMLMASVHYSARYYSKHIDSDTNTSVFAVQKSQNQHNK